MNARTSQLALVAAAVALLAILAYARQSATAHAPPSVYSTYDAGRNGYRALYDVLLAAHVPVRRFERPLDLLDPAVGTLVVSDYAYDPDRKPLDRNDARALRRFVERGGRLVVPAGDFATLRDVVPGAPASHPQTANGAIALTRNGYTAGVEQVRAPIDALFEFRQPRGIPLLANDRGLVAIAYPLKRGTVVAISAPSLFGNAYVSDADNLSFAYDVLAGHGAVAFDEYVHGYDAGASMWSVLPAPVRFAVWLTVAIVAIALIGANVPFAPPVALRVPDERDSSGYIDAVAALMRKARAQRAALDALIADARRRFTRRATPQGREALDELERLSGEPRVSEAALVRAAMLDYSIRKEQIR